MILLIDGTSDSRSLASDLVNAGYSIIASATTPDAVYKLESNNVRAITGRMDCELLISKCKELSIDAIIDASHPYAEIMHENAIKASDELKIPVIRFERNKIGIIDRNITYVEDYAKASKLASITGKNILITTGIKNAEAFENLIMEKNVFFRILPEPLNIKFLIDMGVKKDHIIAMEGNFTENLNKAIMEFYNIDTVITKDSGFNTEPKIRAAMSMKINVIIVSRKEYEWKNVGHSTVEIKKILSNYGIK
ncbi:precorrin-6A reductase [Ferroplasma sp.]|uniref:precorrin-6A reductase n=1 Tax=Ferroplasma sp. TaxID=2591003 RepID=UPI00307FC694